MRNITRQIGREQVLALMQLGVVISSQDALKDARSGDFACIGCADLIASMQALASGEQLTADVIAMHRSTIGSFASCLDISWPKCKLSSAIADSVVQSGERRELTRRIDQARIANGFRHPIEKVRAILAGGPESCKVAVDSTDDKTIIPESIEDITA